MVHVRMMKLILGKCLKWGEGKYKGELWDVEPKVGYEFTNNFRISECYRHLSMSAKVKREFWNGRASIKFQEPSVGIHINFWEFVKKFKEK